MIQKNTAFDIKVKVAFKVEVALKASIGETIAENNKHGTERHHHGKP